MKCGGCVRAVETTLLDQPGVQRADVNLVSRSAWLDLTAGESDVDGVLKALADRGFPAKERVLDDPIGAAAGQALPGWWQQWRQLMVALVLLLLLGPLKTLIRTLYKSLLEVF